MPTWNFKPADKMENTVLELIRQMGWMFSKLDSKNVKRLDTNETTIKSADGTTYIHGPVLEMRDATTQMRLEMGYDDTSGDFIFRLYDADGNLTIDLNSLGEAVFKGNIETSKDATIGETLRLITPTASYDFGIQWIDTNGTTVLAYIKRIGSTFLWNVASALDIVTTNGDLTLGASAGNIILGLNSYIGNDDVSTKKIATQGWVDDNYLYKSDGVTGSFTAASGETITVVRGQITDITL